ncbi:MAG TPA: zinc-dependent alcohol dehydrogenase family protein [Dehalococcoidia bacterium]|nr:zinc-dependent alcohol dehydrogenase family protein [Dehalococcoidia bacterium]
MEGLVLRRPAVIESSPLIRSSLTNPEPGRGELLLEVSACAVCRTDLQLVEGDIEPHRLPVIPGHQVVGKVAAVGDGITSWSVGQRAGVAWLAGTCGRCSECQRGLENLCAEAVFTGWDRDGGYAELTTVLADFALPIPADFDDLSAAPLLCGGVIGYRSLRVSGIAPGERLGLFGFGASASLAVQVARHWDCEVFVCTRSKKEQERALALGAVWSGGYEDEIPAPLDAAVTFAPVGDAVVRALKALGRGRTVAVNAIHLDRVPEFSYEDMWWERSIRSVANFTREDANEFLDLAASIPIRTAVSEVPRTSANEALAQLKAGDADGTLVLT